MLPRTGVTCHFFFTSRDTNRAPKGLDWPLKSQEHAASWSAPGHLGAVIRVPAHAATARYGDRVVLEISRPARPAVCGARRWPLDGVPDSSV